MSIVVVVSLFILIVTLSVLVAKYVQKRGHESFREYEPLVLGDNQGIPLTFLKTIQAPSTAYYKELDAAAILKLVSKATNILTIDSFIATINTWLPSFDAYTANVPFKVMSQKDLNSTTKQITMYRAGKMYGFVVTIVIGQGATVTGFILEQDLTMQQGTDPLGSNVRLYDVDANQFSRKEIITKMQEEVDALLKKQSDALLQDRGISSLILA